METEWGPRGGVCQSHGSVCYACDCKLYRNEICNNIRDQSPRSPIEPPQNLWHSVCRKESCRFVVSWTILVLPFYCKYFAFQPDENKISKRMCVRGCGCEWVGVNLTVSVRFRFRSFKCFGDPETRRQLLPTFATCFGLLLRFLWPGPRIVRLRGGRGKLFDMLMSCKLSLIKLHCWLDFTYWWKCYSLWHNKSYPRFAKCLDLARLLSFDRKPDWHLF